jgi:hypothetical protein
VIFNTSLYLLRVILASQFKCQSLRGGEQDVAF